MASMTATTTVVPIPPPPPSPPQIHMPSLTMAANAVALPSATQTVAATAPPAPSVDPNTIPTAVPMSQPQPSQTASSQSRASVLKRLMPLKKKKRSDKNSNTKVAVHYVAPATLPSAAATAPTPSVVLVPANQSCGDCRICLLPLSSNCNGTKVARLLCNHVFHESCAAASFSQNPKCPICGDPSIEPPLGLSPTGTMYHSIIDKKCPGFEDCQTTIKIEYDIPAGIQSSYHSRPGISFTGTKRKAYLPNNLEGRDLLSRLLYSWKRGLTFTIGTSLTTGQNDVVTWASIPHKTSLDGGRFGWPDALFIDFCNRTLDSLWVPDANECRKRTAPTISLPTSALFLSNRSSLSLVVAKEEIFYDDKLPSKRSMQLIPKTVQPSSTEACSICLNPLSSECCVELAKCKHSFHRACINRTTGLCFKCPLCRVCFDEPRGYSPSGKMTIRPTKKDCPGFGPAKAISITYDIPPGVQKDYHASPGHSFEGTSRVAYLPNNREGLILLERMKYAWKQGLTFTVGTSLTSGKSDVVTWSSIPHKTSLSGGVHGFPDPNYIENCNVTLDGLGVIRI